MTDSRNWNAPWFNRSAWILDNLEKLDVTEREGLVLLVLNYINETGTSSAEAVVADKCHLSPDELDACFDSLQEKGYLNIRTQNRRLVFDMDTLLDSLNGKRKKPDTEAGSNLIHEFAAEFGRPLSGTEMERILQLADEFEESMILRALDEAGMYEKRSVAYVEHVLAAWKKKGLSAQDVENGQR